MVAASPGAPRRTVWVPLGELESSIPRRVARTHILVVTHWTFRKTAESWAGVEGVLPIPQ
jgi:hypothetical protein